MSNTSARYYCDISSLEIDTITAVMGTYDSDGYDIEKFKVENVSLK